MTISGASGISARRLSSFEDGCGENGRAVHGKEESPDGVGASCCEGRGARGSGVSFLFRSLREGTRPCLRGRPMRRSSFLRADGSLEG